MREELYLNVQSVQFRLAERKPGKKPKEKPKENPGSPDREPDLPDKPYVIPPSPLKKEDPVPERREKGH